MVTIRHPHGQPFLDIFLHPFRVSLLQDAIKALTIAKGPHRREFRRIYFSPCILPFSLHLNQFLRPLRNTQSEQARRAVLKGEPRMNSQWQKAHPSGIEEWQQPYDGQNDQKTESGSHGLESKS